MIPPSPCYDRETKEDCPDRQVGCAKTCERWAKYIEKREKVYLERKTSVIAHDVVYSHRRVNFLKKMLRHQRRTR